MTTSNQITRQIMIDGAIKLLATKGLQATSFNEVIALTGAPRGSIYHHFPGGKDQLIAAALATQSERTIQALISPTYDTPLQVAQHFIGLWRMLLESTNFAAGCSVLAVVVASDSDSLLAHADLIFKQWQTVLTSLLAGTGVTADAADSYAAELISACEGAVVMARAARSMTPFEATSARLVQAARLLPLAG